MKSPITGKEMLLLHEQRQLEFRKESFDIVFHYYKCEDSGEQFTTTRLDELNLTQLYNQYRFVNNIPFVDEIVAIRKKYGLSAASMSQILGFGANTYRNYEAGEIPSKANGKLIAIAGNPVQFKELAKPNTALSENKNNKLLKRIDQLIATNVKQVSSNAVRNYIFGAENRGSFTGYKKPDAEKTTQMILFFSERLKPYKTKMNKLLFYADFLNFRNSAFSISGMQYVAIDYGPVPDKFQSLFEYLADKGVIKREIKYFANGKEGVKFIAPENYRFNDSIFTSAELEVLEHVARKFRSMSAGDIMAMSHLEQGWIKNENNKSAISYEYAFELGQI